MSVFSEIEIQDFEFENDYFFIIKDKFPVTPGHRLIISKRQVISYFDLNVEEQTDLSKCIHQAKKIIESEYQPNGYNIGMNCGECAGQTIFHFHCHLIPRYMGDTPNPRGGVRNVIPGKGDY
jgi:diadenosine tetraphosphate (Ap4A) HIT family hydrolase